MRNSDNVTHLEKQSQPLFLYATYRYFGLLVVFSFLAPLTFAVGAFAVPIGMTSAWHYLATFLDHIVGVHI